MCFRHIQRRRPDSRRRPPSKTAHFPQARPAEARPCPRDATKYLVVVGSDLVTGVNHAAIIYEIGVVDGALAPVVVRAMRARQKLLR
jgi:hypothetical protein